MDGEPHTPRQDTAPHEEHARLERLARLLVPDHKIAWGRCLVSILLMLVVVAGTAAGALYWRLGKGPISVPFLTERVRAAIDGKLPPGFTIDLGAVSLARRDNGLVAVLQNLTLRDQSGGSIASAPRIVVGVGGAGLLRGAVEPRSIIVEGAAVALAIGLDGRIGLSAGADVASAPLQAPGDMSASGVLNAVDALMVAAGSIDAVEVRDATLAIHDKALGRDAAYHDIKLAIRRTSVEGGVAVSVAAGMGSVNATIERREDGARLIDIQAKDIALRDLVASFAPRANPPDLTATINALGRASIDVNGTVRQATLNVTSAGGSWRLDPKVRPFEFDQARLDLRWDGATRTVLVERAALGAGTGSAVFQGRMTPPPPDGGDWMIELDAPGMTLGGPTLQDPPLQLDHASIRARYNPQTRRLGFDKAEFSGPTAGVMLAGSVTFSQGAPGIGLGLVAQRMSVTAMKRLWPFFAVPPLRAWFEDHVTGGTVDSLKLSVAIPIDALVPVNGVIPPLPNDSIGGDLVISDGSLRLMDTLPPLAGAQAHATFTAGHVTVSVDQAKVDVGDAGTLTVENGIYEIPDLDVKPPRQHVVFHIGGPTRAAVSLMTREPLARASMGSPLDPAAVTGTAALDVKLDMPLVPKLQDGDIGYAVSGSLDAMTIDAFEGGKLEDGSLKLSIIPGVMLATGRGSFAGLPARIDYRKADQTPPQLTMALTLDDAARRRKGLDFGDALDGPVMAEVRPQNGTYAVEIDLAQARVRDLLPGWQKPPGRPGKATFTWVPQGAGGLINGLALDSGPVSLRGDVTLGAEGKLKRAAFTSFRLSPGDDAQGSIEPSGQGWKATVRGKVLDLRPLLQMLQQRGAAAKAGDLLLDARLDQALGFGDETLSGLALNLETRGSTVRHVDLKGKLGGGAVTIAQQAASDGSPEIVVDTPDAGALLRFLDYYGRISGGVMRLVATPGLNAMAGQIAMRDFSVLDEPALGQYRTTLEKSANGRVDPPPPSSNGNSAQFKKLRLGFRRTPDRIAISDAVVWGPDVGVSISGMIDYAADKVSMTGTFVPAYALNNLFGKIPILGEILGGGENGGLFAINFKVSGSVGSPVLTVNPLSAIAPGFLRKLFEFQKE